ncbi:hypothetical protein B0619_07565 [Campylobacter lari]|nr:hypothetical protein [Campylobacter lari]EAK5787058.1 hypothetical protein [Campylobacter lari]
MKKNIFILFLLLISESAYSCGGCIDSYLGNQNSNNGKNQYDNGENTISKEIESLNKIIQEEITNNENSILKEKKILSSLEKEKLLQNKKESFLMFKNNHLQNSINNLKVRE